MLQRYLINNKKEPALQLSLLIGLLLFLAAAADNISILKKRLCITSLLIPHCELFLNALGASVAAN
jgi:hypothetical protein